VHRDAAVSRRSDVLCLCLCLALTAVAAVGHASLPVDVENAAMKSVGTPQAATSSRAAAEFGVDHRVLLLLEPRTSGYRTADAGPELRAFGRDLAARPEVAALRNVAIGDPDSRLFAVELRTGPSGRYAAAVRALVEAAEASAPPTHRLQVSGFPVGEIAIAEALQLEQRRIVPAIAIALLLLLLACYRRLSLALAVLLPACAGIVILGGIQWACGLAIDPVTTLLAPVLLTVGVAGAVHLVEKFLDHRGRGEAAEASVRAAVRDLLVPASLTAATTVAGFVGLLASPIPAVGRFGLLAAVGVVVSCAAAFVIVPPWLRLFASGERVAARATCRGPWPLLGAGWAIVVRRRARPLAAIALVGTALLGLCWAGLRVDSDPIRMLPDGHPFRTATARIAARVGGVDTFDLLLEGPMPGLAPARLLMLLAGLTAEPGIVAPAGETRRGSQGSYLVPLLLRPAGTSERERTFAAAEDLAREHGFARAAATGAAVLVARDSGALVRGQMTGLIFTILCLFGAMGLGFRSWRLAALGLVPNLLPCVLLYGTMGLTGRPLSVGSAMIGSVMLGVVVDDTIHLLHGYRLARDARSSRATALARSLRRSGRAIVVTSLVLACGFAVGLTGELETTREFGALAAGTILAALCADLVVLPALLLLRRPAASGPSR
jgi:predicted RND superfamily exporter protein